MRLQPKWLALGAVGLALIVAVSVIVVGWLLALAPSLDPPTPPLLRHASTTGGWRGMGCPRGPGEPTVKDLAESGSPEIEDRLARGFPAGSPAFRLQASLIGQGFKTIAPCDADRSIRRATFIQSGGSYPAYAVVAWKVDAKGDLVWTKAAISFSGP